MLSRVGAVPSPRPLMSSSTSSEYVLTALLGPVTSNDQRPTSEAQQHQGPPIGPGESVSRSAPGAANVCCWQLAI
jgi:hypothetical protein